MEARFYPIFVALEGRTCLVVGGGGVAERKVRGILPCGARVRLVGRERSDWLRARCEDGTIAFAGETYEAEALTGADLVFAATSDAALNLRVARDARERGIWCNMASDPEAGSFIVPSVVNRGPLAIAISTTGLSPAVSKRIREEMELRFGSGWAFFLTLLGLIRKAVQARGLESAANQRIFRALAALRVPEWAEAGRKAEALAALEAGCESLIDTDELNAFWEEAWKSSFSS